ncbi:hypothetical protein Ancab_033878 [Ancistrocladus abbreviatus]
MREALLTLILFSALIFSLISLSNELTLEEPQIGTQTASCSDRDVLICEIEGLKLKVARLETILGETNQQLNAKSHYLEKCEKRIEQMDHKIHHLQTVLSTLKGASVADERLTALEEEVRVLWAASRKNNFDIHNLESKAEDADNRLKVIGSKAEMMANIVTELWIQIQQLEQALQTTERRTIELRQQRRLRCMFFQFVSKISRGQHFDNSFTTGKGSIWSFYVPEALNELKRFFRKIKMYHHQLQGFVKQEMEKCQFTAVLANEELVFFVASALVVFPLMGAWRLLSSHWSYQLTGKDL